MKKIFLLLMFFTAIANAQLITQAPSSLAVCDNLNDGVETVDLSVGNGQALFGFDSNFYSVSYFLSLSDAESNSAPLPFISVFPSGVTSVYARVTENADTTNYGTAQFSVNVRQFLVPTITAPISICRGGLGNVTMSVNGPSGFYTFYYTVNGGPVLTVSTINGLSDTVRLGLQNQPGNYVYNLINVVDNNELVCINNVNASVLVTIFPEVIANSATDLIASDSPFDGIATFDLTVNDAAIIGAQGNATVSYFPSVQDAQTNSNPILVSNAYSNVTNPQVIWARIENTSGCSAITSFNLVVTPVQDFINIPDANFKAKLLQATASNTIAGIGQFSPIQYVSVDINGDGEIQYTEALRITYLDVESSSIASLEGLQYFVNLYSLYVSNNPLTELNVSGLVKMSEFNCSSTDIAFLDVSNLSKLCLFRCTSNANLKTLLMKNGSDGCYLEFILSANPNLEYVCTDDSEVLHFVNYFAESNMADVAVTSYCTITPGGPYNIISGMVKFDSDINGCNQTDPTFDAIRVNLIQGNNSFATFTNANGEYKFYTQAGTYTVAPILENTPFFTLAPASSDVTFDATDGTVATNDFCITPNGLQSDVEVVLAPLNNARPGFDATYKITFKNKGNQTVTGNVNLTFDDTILDVVETSVNPTVTNTGSLSWDFTNLMPFENRSIIIVFNVNSPQETPPVNLGNILQFIATINSVQTDVVPLDNTSNLTQTVIGSYDPNDIKCLEGNVVSPSEIGNYLHYVINFENTGTFEAENVVIENVIDESKFDIGSIQILNSSHAVDARISGNKIAFLFHGIDLQIGGHGNILLKVKTNNTLEAGDSVSQRADIFFDYNYPIDTGNENTVFQTLDVKENERTNTIAIYPNPTHSIINIKSESIIKSLQLFDVQGRLLQTRLVNEANSVLDISEKSNGIYFLKVTSDNGIKTEKIIKK